jgi:hypothetical protein
MRARLLALVTATLGCQTGSRVRQAPNFVAADIIMSVRNRTGRALEISLGSPSGLDPLGIVAGESARSFSLPSRLREVAHTLHFEARGGRETIRSGSFSLASGEKIVWTIDAKGGATILKQ